jgi:hypothetical protein
MLRDKNRRCDRYLLPPPAPIFPLAWRDTSGTIEQLAAVPLGLVVNEFLVNSLEYALPEGCGAITVCLDPVVSDYARLVLVDNGVVLWEPPPERADFKRGFGFPCDARRPDQWPVSVGSYDEHPSNTDFPGLNLGTWPRPNSDTGGESFERNDRDCPGRGQAAACKAAKRERRVLAVGVPASHSAMRTILMAVAVRICWSRTLASPRYRQWRRLQRRTAWPWVPSMPARAA